MCVCVCVCVGGGGFGDTNLHNDMGMIDVLQREGDL